MIKSIESIDCHKYEYVVVGSGPAGITLALELERQKKTVLLLEGGGLEYSEKSQDVYDGNVVGNYDYYNIKNTRLRFFGGSSNHWGGWCRPLDEIDYIKFPINKKDLDPYLQHASNILEIRGKFDKDKSISGNFNNIEYQYSPPVRFNKKYKRHIERSKLICLALNVNVLDIRGSEDGKHVKYLNVINDKFVKLKVCVRRLIIACGGIENSRILLYSRSKNKKLFNNLPIGINWMEHPYYTTGKIIAYNSKVFEFFKPFDSAALNIEHNYEGGEIFLQPSKSLIKKSNFVNARITLSLSRNKNSLKALVKDILCESPEYGKKIMSLAGKDLICSISVYMLWEQKPSSENFIELDYSSLDSYGVPRVKLNWGLYNKSKKSPLIYMKKLGELFLDKDLGRVGISQFLNDKNDFPVGSFGGHHMGGTQMGRNSRESVVDSDLKVFGVNNMWVAGSSVFPSSGYANPTLTIVQLSLRLANHLVELDNV